MKTSMDSIVFHLVRPTRRNLALVARKTMAATTAGQARLSHDRSPPCAGGGATPAWSIARLRGASASAWTSAWHEGQASSDGASWVPHAGQVVAGSAWVTGCSGASPAHPEGA